MATCFQLAPPDDASFVAIIVLLGVAMVTLWVRRQNHFFGKDHFLLAHAAMIMWLGAALLELMSLSGDCKVFWAKMAWPGIVLTPTAWALFLLDYSYGRAPQPSRWKTALLIGGPLIVAVMVFTNPWHQAFYGPGTRLVATGLRMSVVYEHGPLFYVAAAYVYLFLMAGIVISAIGAIRAHRRYRMFFLGLLAITTVPMLGNLAYIAFGVTIFGFDPTPFLFSFILFMFTWMIFNNRLMDISAIAKDLLFYNTTDAILIFDATGRVAGANPEAKQLFRATLPTLGGDIRRVEHVGAVAAEVLNWQGNVAAQTLAIGARHFDLRITPIEKPLDRNHAIMGWVLSLIDVTERRFLAGALLAERDYLSKLMDTSMSGIFALDANGLFVFANSEAERILGITLSQVQGLRFDDPRWQIAPVGDDTQEHIDATLKVFLTNDEPARDWRFSFLRADGVRRILSINTAPITLPDSPARLVCAIADITEQERAAAALRLAVERAQAASRAKSQFLANMSHEIRTPLNGVLGMAEVLDRVVQDAEHKRMVTTIRRSGELLLAILNDVLDMSKIEAGKLDLEQVPFRPDTMAARIEELHAQRAEEKNIVLEVFTSGAPEVPRLGDPHRVMQILQNLVSNAIKFTNTGEVTVKFICPRGRPLVIEVKDTGIGMTPDQAARVFEEFEQADGSVTRRFGGTGLGMSIVRKLTQMMGGEVVLDTVLGQGTTVRVTLPLPEAGTA
ncbi:PAS domain S-box protein [Fertoebacter nigrum]|uniref:histidine kinase n=1 Tax=Fertoeibacter niger TaxID=2656921 RepID=A0A8X8KR53_9RHOB|nr:histidine kinase N-terminal 7TM domain-containing protein [Fertoeibacter niger]NUB44827.1 PAS domain S-box protein [Fertoeibacter niger]